MPSKTKRQVEHELKHARLSLSDMNASRDMVSEQLRVKELKVQSSEREVERLKAVLAKIDRYTLRSIASQSTQQDALTDDAVRRQGQAGLADQNQRDTNTTSRESPLLELQRERIRQQQKLLEGGEKENEILRNTCSQQAESIANLELKLEKTIKDNEAQAERIEQYLVQEAIHHQTADEKDNRFREQDKELRHLRNQSAKFTRSKRNLSKFLRDIDFFEMNPEGPAKKTRLTDRGPRTPVPSQVQSSEPLWTTEDVSNQQQEDPPRVPPLTHMRSPVPTFIQADQLKNSTNYRQHRDNRKAGWSWDELDPIKPINDWHTTKHEPITPVHLAENAGNHGNVKEHISDEASDEIVEEVNGEKDDQEDQISEDDESVLYPDDVKDSDYDPENDWDVQTDI